MPPYKLYVVLITEARFRPDISFPRNKSETPQDVLRQLLLQVEVSSICSEYYWLTKVKSLKPKNRNNYHDDRVHFRKVKFQITLHLCQNIKPSVNVLVQCFGYFMRNFFSRPVFIQFFKQLWEISKQKHVQRHYYGIAAKFCF